MAVSGKMYGNAPLKAFSGEINWVSNTIKVSLHTSSYTPDQDNHDYFDDITNEISGTGYTAGGVTLGSKTITYTPATNITKLDASDAVWSTATLTCRYAVIYRDTGTPGTSPVIGYIDFGEDVGSVAGDFTIQWSSDGIFTFTVAA